MADNTPESVKNKATKRTSLVVMILAAVVVGFIAGLGGSMLLTHSLIQRPLQEQQEYINQQHEMQQNELAQLKQEIEQQCDDIMTLQNEITSLIMADSTGRLKDLANIQKEYNEQQELFIQQLTKIEKQLAQIEMENEQFSRAVEEAREELDREDKSLRDDIRLLQSSMNDLNSKIQQLERQTNNR